MSYKNIFKVLSVVFAIFCGVLAYQLVKSDETNKAMLNVIESQKQEINDLNEIIKNINKELNNIKEEQIIKEEIKQAEAHLGDNFYYVDVKCTAYNSSDNYTPSTTMADGTEVYEGAIAYNDVPLGTKVEIDGVLYTVHDRVGHDGVIDIYMDSLDKCYEFGVQYKTVKVYYE